MIARATAHAPATADADATWRAGRTDLRTALAEAATLDLDDYFQFAIGTAATMRGEGAEGALRFPIQARLAGRLFEPVHLDINLTPHDPRPVEDLVLRNLFDFAGLPSVVVPAISPAQQLAEKLHAYTRDYGRHDNTRVKDLYDMLVIADHLPSPASASWPTPAPPPSPFATHHGHPPGLIGHPRPGQHRGPGSSRPTGHGSPASRPRTTHSSASGNRSCTRTAPKPAHGTAAPGPGSSHYPPHRRTPRPRHGMTCLTGG